MDFQVKKAIYLQIADYVCEQILTESWREKEKIPSVRDLAISLEVNPNTVMRTYAFLEERGIIKMQRGIGYFVEDHAYKQVIGFKKEEFLSIELPQVFKSMDLLGIDINDLMQLHKKRKKISR